MKTISWSKLILRMHMYPAPFSYGIEPREAAILSGLATFILLVLTI